LSNIADTNLEELLQEIERTADRPLAASQTLPAEAYTSLAFYKWEEAHLFRAEWQCVAHLSQLANVGDFLTLDLLAEPLVIVRDKDRQIRVLSRACPHRGMDIMPPGFGHTSAEARAVPRGGIRVSFTALIIPGLLNSMDV
jgi:hypothetical protein